MLMLNFNVAWQPVKRYLLLLEMETEKDNGKYETKAKGDVSFKNNFYL